MKDDSSGVAALFDTVDQLADDPRPDTSFIRGEYARLRAGRYRVTTRLTRRPRPSRSKTWLDCRDGHPDLTVRKPGFGSLHGFAEP
jgi:hypothetical protein